MKVRGFSLIEMLVVLTIVVIFMTLIGFNLRILRQFQVQQELAILQSRLHHLQQVAMATGTAQTMHCSLSPAGYRWGKEQHLLPSALGYGILPGVKGPPSHPTTPITSPITFPQHTIIFYPEGIISSGTLYFVDYNNRLYALSCGVGAVSFLRKYRYDGAWKLLD